MRAVIQRVNGANVKVNNEIVGEIGKGLVVLVGIGNGDEQKDIEYITNKIVNLRIFQDNDEKFNKSLLDISGELLIVSQFTLYGDCRKGRRPSFDQAESIEKSKEIYKNFIDFIKSKYPQITVQEGVFQAYMEVNLSNDGPVTFILDSKKII